MKIRHKQTGVVYENVRVCNGEWYIAEDMSPIHAALRMSDCEVIEPTEQWRDVTGECELHGGHLVHKTIGVRAMGETGEILVHVQSVDGYRLRKVQLFKRALYDWKDSNGKPIPGYDPVVAFLIERKESHDRS